MNSEITILTLKDKDKKEYGLIDKKVAYKMQTDKNKSSFAYDTGSLSDRLQGEIKITSESFRRDLLKIQTIKDLDIKILVYWVKRESGKLFLLEKFMMSQIENKEKFVEVSCTTISENLIESENSFGYEKGSHNTAFEGKIGKIESAYKGTLFLDEVGKAH